MTLFRQITGLVVVLIVLLLVGTLTVSIFNTREFVQDQLHSHAQDTATSLSLSIAPAFNASDLPTVQMMVDAVFTQGEFESVVLFDADGGALVERRRELIDENVPAWFVRRLRLASPKAQAEVLRGWKPGGHLKVVSSPVAAYRDLWRVARYQVAWFVCVGVGAIILLVTLLRLVLRPLESVERQAEAICNRDFSGQQPLPRTRELRRVVQAMNRMTGRIKLIFDEQLQLIDQTRRQAHEDAITGLSNADYFQTRFLARIEAREQAVYGAMIVLSLKDFQRYNQQFGHAQGDALLSQLGVKWRQRLGRWPEALLAKRGGAELIAFLPGVEKVIADDLMLKLSSSLGQLAVFNHAEYCQNFHMGLAYCDINCPAESLINVADAAVQEAGNKGNRATHSINLRDHFTSNSSVVDGASDIDWLRVLEEQLHSRDLVFHYQPVVGAADNRVIMHEVLLRLQVDGELFTAAHFMPLVERYGLSAEFDRLVIETVVQRLLEGSQTPKHDSGLSKENSLCINLSCQSLQTEGFVAWLLAYVSTHHLLASQLIFEVPEYAFDAAEPQLHRLATGLRDMNCRLSVDHFGAFNKNFAYLGSVPIYAVKVDHSFIRDLDSNLEHQFFLKSLLSIAHSRDMLLLAESVETTEQWQALLSLQIDGAQGYYLAEPSAIACGPPDRAA